MTNEEKMRRIGSHVRRIREQLVLSQSELAKKANVHVSTVLKIESGQTKRIREATVRSLAQALDISSSEFAKMIGYYSGGTVCIEKDEVIEGRWSAEKIETHIVGGDG